MRIILLIIAFYLVSCTANRKQELINEAFKALDKKDIELALHKFIELKELDTLDVKTYYHIGDCYFRLGDYFKASNSFQKCISLDSKYPLGYIGRADVLMKLKDYSRAKSDYDLVIQLMPNTHASYVSRANYYMTIKDYRNAIKDLATSIKLKSDVNTCNMLGFCYLEIAEYDSSLLYLDAALSIDSTHSLALNNKGFVLFKKGFVDNGIKFIESSIQRDSMNPYTYRNLGIIYASKADKNEACKYFEKSKEKGFEKFFGDEINKLIEKNCD